MNDKRLKALASMSKVFDEILHGHATKRKEKEPEEGESKQHEASETKEKEASEDKKPKDESPAWIKQKQAHYAKSKE